MLSFTNNLLAYFRERLATRRIVFLITFLTALSLIADPQSQWGWQLIRAMVLVMLVVQFRLWDDLADQMYDRVRHPKRMFSRIADTRLFWLLLALSAIVSGALVNWLSGKQGLFLYIMLAGLLLIVYLARLKVLKRRPIRVQLVLLKYPAFLLMVAPCEQCGRLLAVALLAYAMPTLHEWMDARTVRQVMEE